MTKQRAIGVVKFWNQPKGWGAISSDLLPPGKDAWDLLLPEFNGSSQHLIVKGCRCLDGSRAGVRA